MQQSGEILLSYIIQVAVGRSGIKLFQMFEKVQSTGIEVKLVMQQ